MEDNFALTLSHATEIGAIAGARAAGFGNKNGADQAAVTAIREHLNSIAFSGRIVIGEGERDEAPMLYIGEKLGTGDGQEIDIAVDPLENTNATATLGPSAISVLAASEKGGLFHAPDMYIDKLIVPAEAAGKVHLDDPVKKTLKTLAQALKREIRDLTVVILDRDRHKELIAHVREAGARVRLIPDGDLIPGVAVCMRGTAVHAVMGIGGSAEAVMTAAALRCIKGEMQARFWPKNDAEIARLKKMGGDPKKIYSHTELASGKHIIFCATGVTSGEVLEGVRFFGGGARTNTLVMTNQSGKIRFIDTTHVFDKKTISYYL